MLFSVEAGEPDLWNQRKQYMRAFVARLTQAVGLLRAQMPAANLYLIVDAADNAVMAATEFNDAAFVPDLIRTSMPDGVKSHA